MQSTLSVLNLYSYYIFFAHFLFISFHKIHIEKFFINTIKIKLLIDLTVFCFLCTQRHRTDLDVTKKGKKKKIKKKVPNDIKERKIRFYRYMCSSVCKNVCW